MRSFVAVLVICGLGILTAASSSHADKRNEYQLELEEMNTGQELTLDLLSEDKPLILHVWSPDCPHCKRHMPYVAALFKKLDFDEVNFITVAMTDSKQDTRDYMEEKELTFGVMLESSGKLGDGFYKQGWPTTYVFAPGGEYVGWCDTVGPAYLTEVMDLVEEAQARGK